MKRNYIYLTTDMTNGKQYVGSHYGTEYDEYYGSGKIILNIISKYGTGHLLEKEILEYCDPSVNIERETFYIKKHNTLYPNGYNLSETGTGSVKNRKMKEPSPLKGKKRLDVFIGKWGKDKGPQKYKECIKRNVESRRMNKLKRKNET